MKNKWKIAGILFGIFLIGGLWFLYNPVDIRPSYLRDKIADKDFSKGKVLLEEMQDAYGGKENWLLHRTGSYSQIADWYDDKLGIAGWDENPQKYEMTSYLGTDDSEITLLNGPNKGQIWGVRDWKSFQLKNGEREFIHNEKYHHKLIYKNYWFQFPFRISEAPIIAYAGENELEGETYDLLFVTWGSEKANRTYDQYVLYLDKDTRLIEWLHFTLRDKVNFANITAKFTDFKSINGIVAPFSQYITLGSPHSDGYKMHENRYQWIQFGEIRVNR